MKNVRQLLSGIDTLVLSIDMVWASPHFLNFLHARFNEATSIKKEVPLFLPEDENSDGIPFMLQPHGKLGYKWLLLGTDYSLRIMDWIVPKAKHPSIYAELRSEVLWRLGPMEAIQRLLGAIEYNGGVITAVKPSRVDLCMDLLFHEEDWDSSLLDSMVTRASYDVVHRMHQELTGIVIGRKLISARIYDKGKEIATQSGKTWFYDLWDLEEIPKGKRVIRVEFQLRRDVLRELGCKDLEAFVLGLPHVWSYCTEQWLKFMSKPGKHHTQRQILSWWRPVQTSFMGMSQGEPLLRAKAIEIATKRLMQQATGLCSSIIALNLDAQEYGDVLDIMEEDYPGIVEKSIKSLGKTVEDLREDVTNKYIKRSRLQKKYGRAQEQRKRLGLVEEDEGEES